MKLLMITKKNKIFPSSLSFAYTQPNKYSLAILHKGLTPLSVVLANGLHG
jgi:hypothetical protein